MLKGFPRLEDLSRYGSVAESIRDGRGIVFIPSSDPACRELHIDKRGRKSTKTSVLYWQGVEGSGRTISTDRKASFCPYHGFQEVEALLPSSCNQCYDRPLAQKIHEQAGSRRMIDPMGS